MRSGKDCGDRASQAGSKTQCRLAIIADDLTGACDAAVAFTRISNSVRVELDGANFPASAEICAISTDSRDTTPDEAEERLRTLALRLPPEQEVFKKVDSVFRGNTCVEIAASLRHLPFDLAILAPAYPDLGRRVVRGSLLVRDITGERVIPIAESLAEHGVHAHLIAAGLSVEAVKRELKRYLAESSPVVLCDAIEQSDLTTIVRAARALGGRILWLGSGGLAHALAAEPSASKHAASRSPASEGNIVFFVGSNHAATRGQVVHLQRMTGISVSYCHEAPTVDDGHRLLSIALTTDESEIRRAVSGVRPGETQCLFMTGGSTAQLVCRALGIRSLKLEREFAPGIPLALAEGGAFDGVSFVLKSGGFGDRDLLCRILDTFGRKERVLA